MLVTSAPPLSVAMSVYNADRFLDEAIASIRGQSWTDYEFLILNDGSTDGSRAIIDAHAGEDGRIVPIHRENRGLVASLNELLDRARAPIVARMDADDIALPNRFERQLAFLADHPDTGVIGCWTTDIDEFGEPFALAGADHPVTHEQFVAAIPGGPLLCHPSATMRLEPVRAVGGYHAAFRHCEDYDLWLRLAGVTPAGQPARTAAEIPSHRDPGVEPPCGGAADGCGDRVSGLAGARGRSPGPDRDPDPIAADRRA